MLIPIFDDVNRVVDQVRELDPDLFVAFNTEIERYEIHDRKAKRGFSLVMRVQEPDGSYRPLDARVVKALRKSMYLGIDGVIEEIDAANERRKKEWNRRMEEIAAGMADDLLFAGKPVVRGWSHDTGGTEGSRSEPAA